MIELLVAFLILIVAIIMTVMVICIVQFDRKVIELNTTLLKIREINFETLRRIVKIVDNLNNKIKLNKVRQTIEIILTTVSSIQLFMFYKKLLDKTKIKNKAKCS